MARNETKKNKTRNKKNKKSAAKNQKFMEHELFYTILFVIFFMILFAVVGYYSLRVQNKSLLSKFQGKNEENIFVVSSSIVTLTEKNSLEDSLGIKSQKYLISIDNRQNRNVHYQLSFVQDDSFTKSCGCSFDRSNYSMIHYSLDQINSKTFQDENMVVLEDDICANGKKDIVVSLWLKEGFTNHIHGYFVVNEI